MKFELNIESGNEAMIELPGYATAELLRQVAAKLVEGFTEGTLRDANGQLVGSWRLTD